MAPMLANHSILQLLILTFQKSFYNFYASSTHSPTSRFINLLYPNIGSFRVQFLINTFINLCSWSRAFLSPGYGDLQLKNSVYKAMDIIICNIQGPQGSNSLDSKFSQDSYFTACFSAAANSSDVFLLLHNMLLDTYTDHILLQDFHLHHHFLR